jgi:hypothetical protein
MQESHALSEESISNGAILAVLEGAVFSVKLQLIATPSIHKDRLLEICQGWVPLGGWRPWSVSIQKKDFTYTADIVQKWHKDNFNSIHTTPDLPLGTCLVSGKEKTPLCIPVTGRIHQCRNGQFSGACT